MTELDRIGGDLALDFANTLGGAVEGPWDDEWLGGYADLVAWAEQGGLIGTSTAVALRARAAGRAEEAAAAHAAALELREAIYAAAASLTHGDPAPPEALAAVAAANREALAHAELAPLRAGAAEVGDARFRGGATAVDWAWRAGDDLRRPLWPVALAAVDLLRDADRLARLKQCRRCRWLFLDASRNRSRRWCSMEHCGTDAKVRLLRARRAENRRGRAEKRDRRARSE